MKKKYSFTLITSKRFYSINTNKVFTICWLLISLQNKYIFIISKSKLLLITTTIFTDLTFSTIHKFYSKLFKHSLTLEPKQVDRNISSTYQIPNDYKKCWRPFSFILIMYLLVCQRGMVGFFFFKKTFIKERETRERLHAKQEREKRKEW